MAKYQKMLVAIDPNQDDQPALRRAVYLHQRIGGKIKAFLPIYDFSYEMTTLLSPDERTAMRQGVISQRTAWIREQAKYYLEAGVPIDIKVVWHNRPFEAIIQEVVAGAVGAGEDDRDLVEGVVGGAVLVVSAAVARRIGFDDHVAARGHVGEGVG